MRLWLHDPGLASECHYWRARHDADRWQPEGGHALAATQRDATCYWCTGERRRRATRHRKRPDLPPFPDGCQLCHGELQGRRRTWCSDECVAVWLGTTSAHWMLHHLVEIHGHECWRCGTRWQPGQRLRWWGDDGHEAIPGVRHRLNLPAGPPLPVAVALNVDHVRPLWSLDDDERLEPRWWLPFNLQVLCEPCHKAKTKAEAAVRARRRRRERQLVLDGSG